MRCDSRVSSAWEDRFPIGPYRNLNIRESTFVEDRLRAGPHDEITLLTLTLPLSRTVGRVLQTLVTSEKYAIFRLINSALRCCPFSSPLSPPRGIPLLQS